MFFLARFLRSSFLVSAQPAAKLLRLVLVFAAVDAVFLGFAMAYAFKQQGTTGALLYLTAQYVTSTIGYLGAFAVMQSPTQTPQRWFKVGIAGILAGMLGAGLASSHWVGLTCLALAGAGRGAAWATRQWLEMHHTKGEARETYLALVQTATTLFKLALPLAAAAVMYLFSENFQVLFLTVTSVGALALALASRDRAPLQTPPPGTPHPLRTLFSKSYWATAPFYLFEGAGTSLRTALFVSGTLTVVGSVSAYGVLDASSSLLAALTLAVLARRPKNGPSLSRLQWSMGLAAAAWALLLLSLKWPLLLAGFVALNAFVTPLLNTVKSSLILKGLGTPGTAPHDSAMARELLMVLSRLVALVLAALLAHGIENQVLGLSVVVVLMLLFMPAEYYFARRLARQAL